MRISIEHPTGRPNFSVVRLPTISIAFSYETPIAYANGGEWVVRENDWGPTTGKHLNEIDGGERKQRIPGREFEEGLESLITRKLPTGQYA